MLVLGQLMHAANNIRGPPAGTIAIVWAVARALQFTIFTLNLKVNENVTDDVNDSDACVFFRRRRDILLEWCFFAVAVVVVAFLLHMIAYRR